MIRLINQEDALALQEINREAMGYDFSFSKTNDNLKKLLIDSKHHCLIGFENTDHVLIGYVHAERYESLYADPAFNVMALAVHPLAQKQGIGKKLMQALEREAKNQKITMIRLNSGIERKGAHHFYEKNGYHNDKEQKRFRKML